MKRFKITGVLMRKSYDGARYFAGTGWLEPMRTYAQNFEDVTLRRALLDIEQGFFVDIGGYHPTSHSVTKHFYDKGWCGINVEPNPSRLLYFIQERPRDKNLGFAIGAEKSEIDLHIIGDTGLTTTIETVALGHQSNGFSVDQKITVDMISLEQLFSEYGGGKTVDFLKVDVEGAEAFVITPCAFKEFRPRILVVENGDGYHDHLVNNGYIFCWYDCLNRWYVREEDESRCDFVARPVSVWDNVSNIERFD